MAERAAGMDARRQRVLDLLQEGDLYPDLPPDLRACLEPRSHGSEVFPPPVPVAALAEALAELLCAAVERRLRTCLGREFRPTQADLSRVRGHVDMLRTERRQLFMQAKVACRFETLTADTLLNRCVLAALRLLAGLCRNRAVLLCRKYTTAMERAGVGGPCPTESQIQALRQTRTKTPDARKDAHMLHAARVALALAALRRDNVTSA